jgi:hypothetical protein
MPIPYQPKHDYFSPRRIQITGKEILKDCTEDRARAIETYEYFKSMVKCNPEDDKAKSEMVKSLQLSMDSNDKKVKLLENMIKLAVHKDKLKENLHKGKKGTTELSFDDFQLGDD